MLNKFDSSAAPHHLKCQHFLDPFSAKQPFLNHTYMSPDVSPKLIQLSLPELWKYCSPLLPKGVYHQYPKTLPYNLKLPPPPPFFFGDSGGKRRAVGMENFSVQVTLLFSPNHLSHQDTTPQYLFSHLCEMLFLAP